MLVLVHVTTENSIETVYLIKRKDTKEKDKADSRVTFRHENSQFIRICAKPTRAPTLNLCKVGGCGYVCVCT